MLNYIVELKEWEKVDVYNNNYEGDNLAIAMINFRELHIQGKDAILYSMDQEGNEITILENFNEIKNILYCDSLFPKVDTEMKKDINILNIRNKSLMNENERLENENKILKSQYRKVI